MKHITTLGASRRQLNITSSNPAIAPGAGSDASRAAALLSPRGGALSSGRFLTRAGLDRRLPLNHEWQYRGEAR